MTCVTTCMCRLKSLSKPCVSCDTLQNGSDSRLSPWRTVRIRRCATRVPPCATCATLLTAVKEKEVLTQGDTG